MRSSRASILRICSRTSSSRQSSWVAVSSSAVPLSVARARLSFGAVSRFEPPLFKLTYYDGQALEGHQVTCFNQELLAGRQDRSFGNMSSA
jgi:hypothetical protein